MSDPEPPKKKSWGGLQWGVVIVVGLLGLSSIRPTVTITADMANQTSTTNNARQIIMAMRYYAEDNNGVYPDSKSPELVSANQVFRRLFEDDIIQDERIFGARFSRFVPDQNIGQDPNYEEAVAAGENHWALVAKQSPKTQRTYPLLFENALDASWPPKWKLNSARKLVRGRTWKNNGIIIGRNDNSVNVESLEEVNGFLTLPKRLLERDGVPLPVFQVLDIEEGAR